MAAAILKYGLEDARGFDELCWPRGFQIRSRQLVSIEMAWKENEIRML